MAQQSNQPNNSSMISDEILYAVFIIIVIIAAWSVLHSFIVGFYSMIWFAEMFVIGLFTNNLSMIKEWMHATPFSEVTFSQFSSTAGYVGEYSRYVFAPIMIGLGIYAFYKDPSGKYKKNYDSYGLMMVMRRIWPHASMLYEKDTRKNITPGIGLGPALKPREFAKKYKLLDEEGDVIDDAAEDIFSRQIGLPFYGVNTWKTKDQYKLAIVALCVMKFNREFDDFTLLRNRLAEAFHKNKNGDISSEYPLVLSLYEKHCNTVLDGYKRSLVASLESKHAYEYTFLYSLFGKSKRAVFAPNEFAWLKVKNRTMWYVLNSVHRRVAWVEAAGPKAHWLAETLAKKPIKTPIVMEAIVGLKEGIREIKERDYED